MFFLLSPVHLSITPFWKTQIRINFILLQPSDSNLCIGRHILYVTLELIFPAIVFGVRDFPHFNGCTCTAIKYSSWLQRHQSPHRMYHFQCLKFSTSQPFKSQEFWTKMRNFLSVTARTHTMFFLKVYIYIYIYFALYVILISLLYFL